MNKKLFKISFTFSAWHTKAKKPMYAIAESKEAAQIYINSLIVSTMTIKSVLYLGDAHSDRLFIKK